MRSLSVGLAFVFLGLACQSYASSSVMLQSKGPGSFFIKVMGVVSHRSIDVKTKAVMSYKAGYIVNTGGGALFQRPWNNAALAPADGFVPLTLPMHARFTEQRRLALYHTMEFPEQWPARVGANIEERPYTVRYDTWREAILGPNHLNILLQTPAERLSISERSDNLGVWGYGMRVELGFLYAFTERWSVGLSTGWKLEGPRKKERSSIKDLYFFAQENMEEFDIGGVKKKVDLSKVSFAHSKGMIAGDVQLERKVEETLSVMGNLSWRPTDNFSIIFSMGVRRYTLEASYKVGRIALPGTPESYTNAFVYNDAGQSKLMSLDANRTLTLKGDAWPFSLAVSVLYHITKMHSFCVAIEHTSFTQDLRAGDRKDDSKQAEPEYDYVAHKVKNELVENIPQFANVVQNPTVAHQSAAKDIELRLSSTFDVRDVGVSLGYMLTM